MPNALMIHPGECNAAERVAERTGQPVPLRTRNASAMGLSAGVLTHRNSRGDERFIRLQTPQGDVAVVMVDGPVWYDHQAYSCWWCGTDTITLANTLLDIESDETIVGCVIDIDSPGGTVAGINDLITAVDALVSKKPTIAFGHEMMCSLAYWLACRCQNVYATPSSVSGSIGAVSIWYDSSGAAANDGHEAHLFTSDAPNKGMGHWGVPFTESMAQSEQETINAMGRMFRTAVTEKRSIGEEQLLEMAGSSYFGQSQIEHGLVDELIPTTEFYGRVISGAIFEKNTTPPNHQAATQHGDTSTGAHAERTAMDDDLKKKLSELTDEEKQEVLSIVGDDGNEGDEENNGSATTTEDDENNSSASTSNEDENEASAMTISAAKAFLADCDLKDQATINSLAIKAVEKNLSETELLREAMKVQNTVDTELDEAAGGSSSAIGGGHGATGGGGGKASFGSYDEAVKSFQDEGMSHAKAISKVNKEYPELRESKFGRSASFRARS